VWNVTLIGAGYQLGDNWDTVADYVGILQYVVIAAVAGVIAWWIWTRFISASHKARRAAEAAELAAEEKIADLILDATD
jgi:membrane protein DedA with SNARE-associated domain